MAGIVDRRMAAAIEGDFVVFLIGMRTNTPWKVHLWWPVFRAMPRMLRELDQHPECGCLGHFSSALLVVQYWRSFEHLEAYARSHDHLHWPAWVDFNRRMAASRGDVGIWHETYMVRAGEYEAIYSGMPPHGLGKAGGLVPASGRNDSARGRAGRVASETPRAIPPGSVGAELPAGSPPGACDPDDGPRILSGKDV